MADLRTDPSLALPAFSGYLNGKIHFSIYFLFQLTCLVELEALSQYSRLFSYKKLLKIYVSHFKVILS